MKTWTVEQLLGEIAGILVGLENGNETRAREMAELIVGDTEYHAQAYQEYVEEFGSDEAGDEDVATWQQWIDAYRPVLNEAGEPKTMSFADLLAGYADVPLSKIWSLIQNGLGDYYLVPGNKYNAIEYYVTEFSAGIEVEVFVRAADDEIDELNRDQLPWFKENMK